MTCDICGHPKDSHVPDGALIIDGRIRRPCICEQCPDYAPFQGYFGPPPIEQESA